MIQQVEEFELLLNGLEWVNKWIGMGCKMDWNGLSDGLNWFASCWSGWNGLPRVPKQIGMGCLSDVWEWVAQDGLQLGYQMV